MHNLPLLLLGLKVKLISGNKKNNTKNTVNGAKFFVIKLNNTSSTEPFAPSPPNNWFNIGIKAPFATIINIIGKHTVKNPKMLKSKILAKFLSFFKIHKNSDTTIMQKSITIPVTCLQNNNRPRKTPEK